MRVSSIIILMLLLVGITVRSYPQQGCGSSGPEHYFKSSRSDHPERLTFICNRNNIIIAIECSEILEIPAGNRTDSLITEMLDYLNAVTDSVGSFTTPLAIVYSYLPGNNRRLNISANNDALAEFVFLNEEEKSVSNVFKFLAEFRLDSKNTVVIYFNKFSALDSIRNIRFSEIIREAQADIERRDISRHAAKSFTYNLIDARPDTTSAYVYHYADRHISVGTNFGLSYVNGNFVPSISFPLAFSRSSKGGSQLLFGISFDIIMNMAPDEKYTIHDNWFVDGFIIKGDPGYKFFAGYLIDRKGELFPSNSCRLGIDIPLTSRGYTSLRTTYYFSASGRGNLFELGLRIGMN